MRISSVRIENFRSFEDETLPLNSQNEPRYHLREAEAICP